MTKTKEEEVSAKRSSVKRLEKNKREEIHTYFQEYKGKMYFNIRVYAKNKEDEYVPTAKGLTIDPEMVEDLMECIQASIKKEAKKNTVK